MDATLTDHTAVNDAFKIYDDIVSVRNLFLHAGKNPKSANHVFYDSVTDGYGRHSSGSVYIYKNAPDFNVTMHEITHLYMYNLYEEMPDHPNCSQHNIYKVSSQGCAWVEGWAIFIPALFTDGIFEFPNGVVFDLETTTVFEHGDMVEGRVAGALWDVYDDVPDALDDFTAPLADIYKAMWSGGTKHTFREWWEEWKSLGYNVEDAKWSLRENSIAYEPL